MILVAVSLDPHTCRKPTSNFRCGNWACRTTRAVAATDLMRGHRFTWTGKRQHIRLDPADLPFAIWQVAPAGAP